MIGSDPIPASTVANTPSVPATAVVAVGTAAGASASADSAAGTEAG